MNFVVIRRALALFPLILLLGCLPDRVELKAFKTQGVDHIPTKIGFFTFLSNAVQGSYGTPYQYYGASEARILSATPRIKKTESNVAIVPATGMDLVITPDGQMLTDLVTTSLAAKGFSLKQLPVEMQEAKDKEQKASKSFYISLNLLMELKEKFGIEAIALGDAFFTTVMSGTSYRPETRVTMAHIKIVDITTLDVLAEVSTPYQMDGFNINQTSDALAESLGELAGISPKQSH